MCQVRVVCGYSSASEICGGVIKNFNKHNIAGLEDIMIVVNNPSLT